MFMVKNQNRVKFRLEGVIFRKYTCVYAYIDTSESFEYYVIFWFSFHVHFSSQEENNCNIKRKLKTLTNKMV